MREATRELGRVLQQLVDVSRTDREPADMQFEMKRVAAMALARASRAGGGGDYTLAGLHSVMFDAIESVAKSNTRGHGDLEGAVRTATNALSLFRLNSAENSVNSILSTARDVAHAASQFQASVGPPATPAQQKAADELTVALEAFRVQSGYRPAPALSLVAPVDEDEPEGSMRP